MRQELFNEIKSDPDQVSTLTEKDSKYGIPVTLRLPAQIKKELGDEAVLRGISFAQYLASLLLTGHQQSSEQTAETNMLLRERELYKQKIAALERKVNQQESDLPVLAILTKNRDILKNYADRGIVTKELLDKEGYNFYYQTHVAMQGKHQLFCVFDMAYIVGKDQITIKTL